MSISGFLILSMLQLACLPGMLQAQSAALADFDDSGSVSFPDFLLFAEAFGSRQARFDLDGSGTVAFPDFLAFAQVFVNYGQFALTGAANYVRSRSIEGLNTAGHAAQTSANNRASFNSGVPLEVGRMRVTLDVQSLASDAKVDFFIYSPFVSDGNSAVISFTPVNMQQLTVDGFFLTGNANEIKITLSNPTSGTITKIVDIIVQIGY